MLTHFSNIPVKRTGCWSLVLVMFLMSFFLFSHISTSNLWWNLEDFCIAIIFILTKMYYFSPLQCKPGKVEDCKVNARPPSSPWCKESALVASTMDIFVAPLRLPNYVVYVNSLLCILSPDKWTWCEILQHDLNVKAVNMAIVRHIFTSMMCLDFSCLLKKKTTALYLQSFSWKFQFLFFF